MERVQLIGVESVESASVRMRSAADEMLRAANMISESVRQFTESMNNTDALLVSLISAMKHEEEEGE